MAIFDIPADATPEAVKLAKGFLAEANVKFDSELNASYDAVNRFWYRNGEGEVDGDQPSGIEVLQAMGPNAKSFIDVAFARVQMLLAIEAGLGLSGIVDLSKVAGPFELTFAEDGSLELWQARS